MIKNETIILKVSSGLKQNYSNLGYNLTQKEVEFKIKDLKESSNQRIDVICDLCQYEYNIQYAKYIKNVTRNGFYSCKKCAMKKRSEQFKSDNPSLDVEMQKRKKETFIKNYGVDNPSKSEKVKQKKKETCLINYGVTDGLKLRERVKNGMREKYGVDHALQSDGIKEKMINSLITKYGVDNVSKLISVKQSKNETFLKNYGIYPDQNKIVFKKQLLKSYRIVYYNDELFSQGTYELDFLNYCENNDIINLISNGPSVEYILESNNTNHLYYADFYIEKYNLIVEIKSNYTYNVDLDKNLMKEKYSKLSGYNFLFIIDKNYSTLNTILNLA